MAALEGEKSLCVVEHSTSKSVVTVLSEAGEDQRKLIGQVLFFTGLF